MSWGKLREPVAVEQTLGGGRARSAWTVERDPQEEGVTVRQSGWQGQGGQVCAQVLKRSDQASAGWCLHFLSPSENSKLKSREGQGRGHLIRAPREEMN